MKALVTGATGFVGRQLLRELDRPRVLTRRAAKAAHLEQELGVELFEWPRPQEDPPPAEALEGVDTVFHLAGDPVAEGRWNTAKKRRIMESRQWGTRRLVEAFEQAADRPRALVSASAVGFYGDRGDEELDEQSGPQPGNFLSDVCQTWEREARRAEDLGVQTSSVRIGIVLGRGGGALAKMSAPVRWGVGGRLGSGRQWMPWIHLDDLIQLLLRAARDGAAPVYNGSAPNPQRNLDFTKCLGRQLKRPTLFPAPRAALRVAVGEFANVLLESQRAHPRAANAEEFVFAYPELPGALADLLAPAEPGAAAKL